MKITKKQITSAIDKANLNRSSYGCDRCWLDHLGLTLGILDEVKHPCSYMKELLNKQYHTNYKITPGSCNVTTFPTAEILSKLNTRIVRI
jgi:hypothetical protein